MEQLSNEKISAKVDGKTYSDACVSNLAIWALSQMVVTEGPRCHSAPNVKWKKVCTKNLRWYEKQNHIMFSYHVMKKFPPIQPTQVRTAMRVKLNNSRQKRKSVQSKMSSPSISEISLYGFCI